MPWLANIGAPAPGAFLELDESFARFGPGLRGGADRVLVEVGEFSFGIVDSKDDHADEGIFPVLPEQPAAEYFIAPEIAGRRRASERHR
jgi:hypothetical protein